VSEPILATVMLEPILATGVSEPILATCVSEPIIATGMSEPILATGVSEPIPQQQQGFQNQHSAASLLKPAQSNRCIRTSTKQQVY
jgi:hypothetical protein